MTKEDKELLLKDLCARFLYNVKVLYNNKVFNVDYISAIYEEIKLDIPEITKLGNKLQECGIPLSKTVLSVDELTDELIKVLGNES